MGKLEEFTAHLTEVPVFEINDGVAVARARSGNRIINQAMSVKVLSKAVDRARRALERYANGEQNIIVDD